MRQLNMITKHYIQNPQLKPLSSTINLERQQLCADISIVNNCKRYLAKFQKPPWRLFSEFRNLKDQRILCIPFSKIS